MDYIEGLDKAREIIEKYMKKHPDDLNLKFIMIDLGLEINKECKMIEKELLNE